MEFLGPRESPDNLESTIHSPADSWFADWPHNLFRYEDKERASPNKSSATNKAALIRGNHMSNTTCVTHAFFKHGD